MSSNEEEEVSRTVKNATDLQRLKLEKLMKNPEKPVFIPEKTKEKKFPNPPEFVRNVMGSSAGAGSGEFHVYRHIRRREYARQEFLNQVAEKERMDIEYKKKIEENMRRTEEKTAKRRAKRLRAKQRLKVKRKTGQLRKPSSRSEGSSDESEFDEQINSKRKKICRDATNEIKNESSAETESSRSEGDMLCCDSAVTEGVEAEPETRNEKDPVEISTVDKSVTSDKTGKKSLKELLKMAGAKLQLDPSNR